MEEVSGRESPQHEELYKKVAALGRLMTTALEVDVILLSISGLVLILRQLLGVKDVKLSGRQFKGRTIAEAGRRVLCCG